MSNHLAVYEDPKVYTTGVIQFLRDVDAGAHLAANR
jgi:hypothetical protein